jgi:competence ComEA-like helix-hairpin-helix protein
MRRVAVFFVLLTAAQAQDLPDGKGKDLVEDRCSSCHGLDLLLAEHDTKQQWSGIVNDMVSRGASGTAEELQTIIDYLAKNFGPEAVKIHVNAASAEDLQSGLMLTAPEAAAIVQYRKEHGKIKDWEALSKIPGIDAKKLESHKDLIVFD